MGTPSDEQMMNHVASVVAWLRGQEWVGEKPTRGQSADALGALCARLAALEADARRYQWLRNGTMGDRHPSGRPYFLIVDPRPVGNIMQGSVAEHLDEAIDAALAKSSDEKAEA